MYPSNRTGVRVTLVVVLSLCTPALEADDDENTVVPARNSTVLDVPRDAELLVAYNRDLANRKVQSWGQYRGWVQTFYEGNLMSAGWCKFAEMTVAKMKSAAGRQAVLAQLNELGKIIGLEWAKDSSVRKITTSDLRRWNDVMVAARQSDDGSGQRTIDALTAVRRMAQNRRSRG
jgi:hypothetical protein